MAFLETPRFPTDVSYGSQGGPMYRTDIVTLAGGGEARNSRWTYPLHTYEASFGVRTAVQLETLLALFHAVGGRANGFRFKDWADYKSNSVAISPAATDQAIGTGDTVETDFQLIKTYTSGALSKTRIIQKPVTGTVLVALNGVPQGSGWSVDTTTGIVTFVTPPGAGVAVTAGYEFDVPVRFDTDQITANWQFFQLNGTQVPLMEIRV